MSLKKVRKGGHFHTVLFKVTHQITPNIPGRPLKEYCFSLSLPLIPPSVLPPASVSPDRSCHIRPLFFHIVKYFFIFMCYGCPSLVAIRPKHSSQPLYGFLPYPHTISIIEIIQSTSAICRVHKIHHDIDAKGCINEDIVNLLIRVIFCSDTDNHQSTIVGQRKGYGTVC